MPQTVCAPVRLSARLPSSPRVHRCGWAVFPSSVLPVCRLCRPTPSMEEPWDLPSSRRCHEDVPRSSTPVGSRSQGLLGSGDVAFRTTNSVGTHGFVCITGRNPCTLAHCGPSSPCVCFTVPVPSDNATRGTRCLARPSEAGPAPG